MEGEGSRGKAPLSRGHLRRHKGFMKTFAGISGQEFSLRLVQLPTGVQVVK